MKCVVLFGVALIWLFDCDSHFKNMVIDVLNRSLHGHHHFKTPCFSQSNCTVKGGSPKF